MFLSPLSYFNDGGKIDARVPDLHRYRNKRISFLSAKFCFLRFEEIQVKNFNFAGSY